MGLDDQGSRALALLQRVAGHVEAILGHLDRFLGHHHWCRSGGLAPRTLRIQNVSTSRLIGPAVS